MYSPQTFDGSIHNICLIVSLYVTYFYTILLICKRFANTNVQLFGMSIKQTKLMLCER